MSFFFYCHQNQQCQNQQSISQDCLTSLSCQWLSAPQLRLSPFLHSQPLQLVKQEINSTFVGDYFQMWIKTHKGCYWQLFTFLIADHFHNNHFVQNLSEQSENCPTNFPQSCFDKLLVYCNQQLKAQRNPVNCHIRQNQAKNPQNWEAETKNDQVCKFDYSCQLIFYLLTDWSNGFQF